MLDGFRRVDASDALSRLRLLAESYVDYACANPDLFRAMFLFRPELTAEPRGDQPPLARKIIDAIAAGAADAQQAGQLPEMSSELAGLTVWTAAHGVVTVLLSGPPIDIEMRGELAHTAIEAAVAGLEHRRSVQAA
jgi:hypothetical protein